LPSGNNEKEERNMWEVLIGAAAGIAVAATGVMLYRQGLKDGRRTPPMPPEGEPGSALLRKYEAIMDYDPYGERV
jgi:hypothetical protein